MSSCVTNAGCCEVKTWTKEFCAWDKHCVICDDCNIPLTLLQGHYYGPCVPLVSSDEEVKGAPLQPMTSPDECIVGFVRSGCGWDLTTSDEDCTVAVITQGKFHFDNICWPPEFTEEEKEAIRQDNRCCLVFIRSAECAQLPGYLQNQV